MELNAIEPPGLVGNGGVGTGIGVANQRKAIRNLCHIVAMAHPGNGLLRNTLEQLAAGVIIGGGFPVFPGGILLRGSYLAAQGVCHELAAVADA